MIIKKNVCQDVHDQIKYILMINVFVNKDINLTGTEIVNLIVQ